MFAILGCGGSNIPGNLTKEKIPKMVILTFQDSLNNLNQRLYQKQKHLPSNQVKCVLILSCNFVFCVSGRIQMDVPYQSHFM